MTNNRSNLDRSALDALKAQVNLADVMATCGVEVRRVGQNQMALCPFHPDKTPSLSVHGQLYKCQAGCGAKGDVLDFLIRKEELTFQDALARLQSLVGQVPPAPPPAPLESIDRLAGGFTRPELLKRVAQYYASHLLAGRQAKEYLASRGFDHPELWDAFQVGYADGSLRATLPANGAEVEALTQLGVLNERGKEHFYGCIVVPLSHPDTGIVGLYGRRILANSKVTHLYLRGAKRGVLNWQALKASSSVVLAECVLDALSIWVAAVRDVTCLFGAGALSVDLEEMLRRFGTEEVRFCLDADPAGQNGTHSLARTFLQQGIRCQSIHLPDGQDANDVLLTAGAEGLRHTLEQATPVGASSDSDEVSAIMPQVETVDHGFIVHFGAVVYRVTPRAPFTGRLQALVRGTYGPLTSAEQVNFYSDRNRTQWVRNAARNLKLATTDTEAHMTFLLAEAERWVEYTVLRSQQEAQSRPEPMTDKEKTAVQGFLRLANLVEVILSDMEALGYVGEEKCKLLAYLVGLSRRMERPMSGIILSQSGAGKSALTELIESLTPPEEVELFSRLSPMALGYMAKDYLKRKLLILEERVGAEASDYFIRTLQTKNFLRHAVPMKDPLTGQMHTRIIEVEGPIAYLETTTQTRINFENATRCFELTLDESEAQTARIHERQRLMRDFDTVLQTAGAREPVEAIRRRHHQAQRLLEPARILNRFKPHLRFPKRWLRTRRDHERFLSLVDVITFLHQYSRESGTFLEGDTPVRYVVSPSVSRRRWCSHWVKSRSSAVKAFSRFLAEEQYVLIDPGQGVALPRLPRLLPRVLLTEDDVVQLLEAPDVTTTLGLRDRAVLEVLYSSAVRNTELRQMRVDDVSLNREELYIREGKGGKSRVVPLGQEACYWLGVWLEEGRLNLVPAGAPNPAVVFLSWRGRPLTRESLSDLVVRTAQAAGLSEHVTPHLLRHCCATHMLARGAGLRHLQELLGHECAQTTQRYTRIELSDLREVHRRCHPREVGETGEVAS